LKAGLQTALFIVSGRPERHMKAPWRAPGSGAPVVSSMRLWRLKDYLGPKLIDARVSGAGYTAKDTFTSDRINGNVRYIAIWGTPLGVVDRVPGSLSHRPLLTLSLDGAGAQKQQLQEIASVQRQLRDLPLGDDLSHRGGLGVERHRARFHLDDCADVADRQIEVGADDLVDVDRDVRLLGGVKALMLHRHRVNPYWEKREDVYAFFVRCSLTRQACERARDLDPSLCQHGAVCVLHYARDLAGCCLRHRRPCHSEH